MKPADRIAAITRCAERLSDYEWSDLDFVLSQFGLPTTDYWDGGTNETPDRAKFLYVRDMLSRTSADDKIAELDAYLDAGPAHGDPGATPWADAATLRIFLSHVAVERSFATEVKDAFALWGADSFVAHEDIDPGVEWLRVILAGLHSCDALVALLHSGFSESNWCDQEVGVAIGRGVPTIPVRLDHDPYGFLGSFQAVSGTSLTARQLARAVIEILIKDKRTSALVTSAVVDRLAAAWSYSHAIDLSGFLVANPHELTWAEIDKLRQAERVNRQLAGAYSFDSNLRTIESNLPPRASSPGPPQGYEDQEPF